jgi:hypothetical protein
MWSMMAIAQPVGSQTCFQLREDEGDAFVFEVEARQEVVERVEHDEHLLFALDLLSQHVDVVW